MKFQHLLSKYEHVGKAAICRRQPCGKKARRKLQSVSAVPLLLPTHTNSAVRGPRLELWWQVSPHCQELISGQRLGGTVTCEVGLGHPLCLTVQCRIQSVLWDLLKDEACGRLIWMSLVRISCSHFLLSLTICILYWMSSSDLEIFYHISLPCIYKKENVSKVK